MLSMMKKHLIFVLIFLIIAPILTVSWLWHDMIKSEQAIIQCHHEKNLLAQEIPAPLLIEYQASDLQDPSYTKHLRVILLTLCFFVLGGYFFREYLLHYGKSEEQVSFVNQVSHELKTPLTNIKLYADMLIDQQQDNPEMLKKLGVISQETKRLEQLVNNVLLFGQGKKLRINKQDHNIDQIIEEIAEGFIPRFKEKGMEIILNCNAGKACIDRNLLEQVLINLLSNAAKYASGSKKVEITASHNDYISIVVRDYGSGIPDHLRDKILEPFMRDDNNIKESGLGIGLPLCMNLLKVHGGKLKLLKTDKGAAFEVIL